MLGALAKGPGRLRVAAHGLVDVAEPLVGRQAPGRLHDWCAGEGPGRLRVAAHGLADVAEPLVSRHAPEIVDP